MADRCRLSGVVVTAIPGEDWIEGRPYICHACGASVGYRIRATDYPGQARLSTHDTPANRNHDDR